MRKLALALAAVAALGLSVPAFTSDAGAAPGRHADKVVKVKHGRAGMTKKVIVRHDRGLHRGWAQGRHHGATKKVVIKHRGNGTVVKKKIVHRG
ncbi:MAG TPA: hypothetical protein VGD36_19325 [Xanthobacteraceae bacterium]|jgi:hypothetical protein